MATSSQSAKAVVLDRPCLSGLPTAEYFRVIDVPTAVLTEDDTGSILVQTLVASADPYLRGRIKALSPGSILKGVFQAGRVIASNNPSWVVGDLWGGKQV